MAPLKIVLFYGSTRTGRLVERVGSYVKGVVEAKGMEAIVLGKLIFTSHSYKTQSERARDRERGSH